MPQQWTTFFAAAVLVVATAGVGSAQLEPIEELRAKAEQGDAKAQNNLGNIYYNGEGVPQDDAEAVRWWRLAADQGEVDAQHNLGQSYRMGLGVPQDNVQAYKWLNLSATSGHGEDAVKARDLVANNLSPDQLAEAQRLAREWDEAHPRD
jgi:TPR repeat protein